jgi:hypothetical protein
MIPAPHRCDHHRMRARVVATARIAIAALIVAAVTGELFQSIHFWHTIGVRSIPGKVLDFFLFFTEDSNLATALVFVIGAVMLIRHGIRTPSATWVTVRMTVTSAVVLTAVGDNLLLRGTVPAAAIIPWADTALHVVVPALVLLDWLVGPDRRAVPVSVIGKLLVFPVIWLAITMLRGPFTGDQASSARHYYPYFFLDPDHFALGYLIVALYIVGFLVVLCLVALLLVWTTHWHAPGATEAPTGTDSAGRPDGTGRSGGATPSASSARLG